MERRREPIRQCLDSLYRKGRLSRGGLGEEIGRLREFAIGRKHKQNLAFQLGIFALAGSRLPHIQELPLTVGAVSQ